MRQAPDGTVRYFPVNIAGGRVRREILGAGGASRITRHA
jgi:hypothetical protein